MTKVLEAGEAGTVVKRSIPLVLPQDIHHFQDAQADERAGSFGDPIGTFPQAFAERGWDAGEGAVVAYVADSKDQKRAIEDRKRMIDEWRKLGKEITLFTRDDKPEKITYKELADFAEKLWTDDKGKWTAPTYIGVVANRRGYAFPASVMAYQRWHETDDVFAVPVVVKEYASEKEKFLDRLAENARYGQSGYSLLDMFAIAVKCVKFGMSETELMRELNVKRGAAQKLHTTATIARRFEELDLVRRATLPRPTDKDGKIIDKPAYSPSGWYPYSSITAAAGRTLLGNAKTAEAMDDLAVEAMGHREPGRAATEEQVEAYIKLLFEDRKNAPAVMDKSNIKVQRDAAPVEEGRQILDGVLSNNAQLVSNAMDDIKALKNRIAELERENADLKNQLKASKK